MHFAGAIPADDQQFSPMSVACFQAMLCLLRQSEYVLHHADSKAKGRDLHS